MSYDPVLFTPDQKLLALSWRQPYLDLMPHGKIETRTWSTSYRGWVLMCASKQPYKWHEVDMISGDEMADTIFGMMGSSTYQPITGHALAIGWLDDCRPMTRADEGKTFVQYRVPAQKPLFCHIYRDVREIEPFPWKGTQGWKEVSQDVKDTIRFRT